MSSASPSWLTWVAQPLSLQWKPRGSPGTEVLHSSGPGKNPTLWYKGRLHSIIGEPPL